VQQTDKHIVILSPAWPLRGGIAASTHRLAQELQVFGYRVTLFSFSLQYPSIFFPGKTQYTDDPAPEGLQIETKINSVNPFNWLKVGKELREMKPDIIISRFWMPFFGPSLGTILRQAKKNGHTQCLGIVDNIIPHEHRPGDRPLAQYYVQANDAFITMSRAVKEEMGQFTTGQPIRFVPHPIYDNYGALVSREAAMSHLKLDPSFRYILFFGFIRDYKGLDLLLEAMADARLRKMPLRLIVAGEYYGNEERYQQLIQQLGIRDQVMEHTYFIPQADVKHYFAASDLVVQPYRTATQSGISQLAYHFEKPMVATAVGGLPEIIAHGEGGYVVDVDPQAVANAIFNFFDLNQGDTFTAKVREMKGQFSWSKMVEAMEELLGLKVS